MIAGHRDDVGFTVLELMVSVMIIGILMGIAVPTFLGARSRAHDRAAESSTRNALVSYLALPSLPDDVADLPALMAQVEPAYAYTLGPSTSANEVSVTYLAAKPSAFGSDVAADIPTMSAYELRAATRGESGRCALGIFRPSEGNTIALVDDEECRASLDLDGVPPGTILYADGAWDFEVDGVNGWRLARAGELGDWEIDGVELDGAKVWKASNGNVSLDLNGHRPGSIARSIETTPGREYEVRFDMSGNPHCGRKPAQKSLQLAAGGEAEDFAYDVKDKGNNKKDMKWEEKTLRFKAGSAESRIQFKSTSNGSCGPAIDNVRIVAL